MIFIRESKHPFELITFDMSCLITFLSFFHEHRLPVECLASPDLTFLVKPVELLPDFIPNLVHEVNELDVGGFDVVVTPLSLEAGDDG